MRSLALITFVCTVVLASLVVDVGGNADSEVAGEPKRGLKRWLSFGSTPDSRKQSEELYQDGAIGKGNNNKVSELLHFIHRKSSSSLSKKPKLRNDQGTTNHQGEVYEVEPEYKSMSDQKLMESFCEGRALTVLCKKAMDAALRKNPEDVARIAQAIRDKPAHIDASKLLAHKLFETGVVKIESKGYDKALDMAINVVANRNPYMYSAVKAIDLTRKLT